MTKKKQAPVVYSLRGGSETYRGIHKDVLCPELARLGKDGKLTPEDVVREAEAEDSLLHPGFTWDKDKGWKANLLHEARTMIRVVVVHNPEMDQTIPLYTNVIVENGQYYRETSVLVEYPDEWASAIKQAETRLRAAERDTQTLYDIASDAKAKRKIKRALAHVASARSQVAHL